MQALLRSRLAKWIGLGVLVAIPAWLALREFVPGSAPVVCTALAQRRIVQLFAGEGVSLRCPGVNVERLDALGDAVLDDPAAGPLVLALQARKGSAIAVVPNGAEKGVSKLLSTLQYVPGLRGVVLSSELAVYAPSRVIALTAAERDALAYVARVLFRGAREPNVNSFPPSLRRVEPVEVMVLLSRNGEPRLWRSARGTSIARALLTATRVARDRWREREQAMGGPLTQKLMELDVEVSLLAEDGTLASAQRSFVDRAITSAHGVGYDHRTAWHYLLPRDVQKRGDGPFAALASQIADNGNTLAILGDSETRLYRFVTEPLGHSRAPLPTSESP